MGAIGNLEIDYYLISQKQTMHYKVSSSALTDEFLS